jgi:uncharacterized delta-60 repeat protein
MKKCYATLVILSLFTFSLSSQTLDPTFANAGKAGPFGNGFLSAGGFGKSMALQADSKIVIAGYKSNGSNNDFALMRLNGDGTVDNTFGTNGIKTIDAGNDEYAYAIAVQPDGKILLTGYRYYYVAYSCNCTGGWGGGCSTCYSYYYDAVVVRLNGNGTLDNSFDGDGIKTIDLTQADEAFSLALQQDGKILVGGYSSGNAMLVRLNSNGSLDGSFNGAGYIINNFSSVVYSIGVQPDNKIVAVGYQYGVGTDFAIARFNGDGTFDNSFDGDGKKLVDIGSGNDVAYSVAIQVDSKIVLAGYSNNGGNDDFSVIRLNADGSMDNSFDEDGKKNIDFNNNYDEGRSVLVRNDGKIFISGVSYDGSNYDFGIACLNQDGSMDNSFDNDGKFAFTFSSGFFNIATCLLFQNDGKLLVGDYSSGNAGIIRLQINEVETLSCPGNISVNTNNGLCTAAVNDIDPIVSPTNANVHYKIEKDGVEIESGNGSVNGKSFGKGITTVTYTLASDAAKSCSFTVTVEDKQKPTVITQDITVQLDENGVVSITPSQINKGSTDNCTAIADLLFNLDKTKFDCSNVGATTTTLTVTDGDNNSETATATVTVEDKIKPTVVTQNITVQLDANGSANVTAAQINNGSTDNCSIAINGYSLDKTSFHCSDVGQNTVTLTVTDVNGNSNSKTATVTVEDKVKPTVATQNITVQLDANGSANITTAQVNNGSTDNCSIPVNGYSLDKTSFHCSDVGQNTVTLTVTDVNGNSNSKTATVTVEDKIKPTVVTQNITVQLDANGSANVTAAQINNGSTDNCSIAINGYSLDKTSFHCSDVGQNTVTLTVTDVNGNSNSKTATVTIEDKVKPTVVTQNITVQLDANGSANITATQINNGSTDNCSIPLNGYSLDKTSFHCSDVGQNTVTLTVTDVNGNSDSKTATVTVEDKIKPTVVTQNITVQLDANGSASITPAQINNGSTDNCSIPVNGYSLNKTIFHCSDVGQNIVTLTVTDVNGNSDSKIATVTVEDHIKPIANCKNIDIYLGQDGTVSITPEQVDNGSHDACGISLSLDKSTFTTSNVGANLVVLTVKDPSNNSSTCQSTVTVKKRPTTLVYTGDGSEQYSDQQFLKAELRDQLTNSVLTAKLISFTIGSQSASATTNASGVASTNLIITQDPAPAYTVQSAFAGDEIYLASSDEDPFDILQEDTRTYYTGALFASTSGITSTSATVTLSATIKDITAVGSGDPSYDAFAGDIRNATVTFYNADNNSVLAANVPVGLVNVADKTVGTATANVVLSTGSAGYASYTIGIKVNNYYIRYSSSEHTVITIAQPLNDFITGGGYLILNSPAGQKAGDANSRNNFGFNVKYNKSQTNLQGNINAIVRRTETDGLHVYQVKGNSMTSFSAASATTTSPGKATFNGKASIQDITNPLFPQSVDGNATLQVTMTDNGEPGTYDATGITVWNKSGGLWFASNWDGTRTQEQILAGGNLRVNTSTNNAGTISNIITLASSLNPSATGQQVTFKATVAENNSAIPTGYIMFIDGTTVLSTVTVSTVNNITSASFATSSLNIGSHQIKAYYSGDTKFASGTAAIAQTVTSALTVMKPTSSAVSAEKKYAVDFDAMAWPNPANDVFNVIVRSNDGTTKITVKVFDAMGRVVDTKHSIAEGETLKLGENYRPGVYVIEIVQGSQRKTLKLIKQPD